LNRINTVFSVEGIWKTLLVEKIKKEDFSTLIRDLTPVLYLRR